eukprot:6194528-Pleurochrysis_carterae.AAC.3
MAALRDNHTHSTTLTRAGQCVLSYPWMQAALNGFFAPFYEDLHLSHSINATFDAYRMIDKTGATFYLPAWKAELEVGYNQKGPSISVLSTKGGQQGKQKGMLKILQAAMIEFAPELRPLFRDEVRMFIHFNDFPMTYKRLPNATKLRVPAFAMAGTKQALEVPIPDFTFAEYEKVSYTLRRQFVIAQQKSRLDLFTATETLGIRSKMDGFDRSTDSFNSGRMPAFSLLDSIATA